MKETDMAEYKGRDTHREKEKLSGGLKLKLRPEERVLINGAVIQNGSHQIELTVKTPNTKILRLRDALHPDDVNTPTRRVCYIAQLAVAGEVSDEEALEQFTAGVTSLKDVFKDIVSQGLMTQALEYAKNHDFYKAMQAMRKVMKHEEILLNRVKALETMMPQTQNSGKNDQNRRAFGG
jgi:flagellar biosynthesis repressor protein FlbT